MPERFFRVLLTDRDGTSHEVTGRAQSSAEAVAHAQNTIDYLNRVGPIEGEAAVTEIDGSQAGPGFGFVMTTPSGRIIRK